MTLPLPPALEAALNSPMIRPFDVPYRMQMGLVALRPDDWFQVDHHHLDELAEKQHLLAARSSEIFGNLPEAELAMQEAARRVSAHLAARFPGLYSHSNGQLRHLLTQATAADEDFLKIAALCQEDLCILQSDGPDQAYRLTAAALYFPSRWRLHEKLGLPLTGIHQPVPGLNARMAPAIDRFFSLLAVGRPVVRANWTLIDDPALFQPRRISPPGPNPALKPDNAGSTVQYRSERQTLTRLAETGAVLFTIKTIHMPLSDMARTASEAAEIAAALRALPDDIKAYKSLDCCLDAALAWLDWKTYLATDTEMKA